VSELRGEVAGGKLLHEGREIARDLVVAGVDRELAEVVGDGADVLGDGPLVVVEDTDELLRRVGDVVQTLEGDAVRHRRVAEDADDMLAAVALVAGGTHAERGGNGGARVAGSVAVVLALGAEGEAVQAVGRPDGVEAVLPAGQQLVDIDLMAHVPDEFVLRRGEHAVHGDGQFHDPQIGTEVAAIGRELGDQFFAHFLRELDQLIGG
jgi:hypothetical protein